MKVLIVHDYGTLNGGAEHMSVTLRDGLRARGHESRFFSSTAKPLPLPIVADESCYGTTGPLRRVTQVANPAAPRALARAIRQFAPDVVHLRMFMTQLSPLILRVLRGVPTVLHVVNYDLICPLNVKRLPDGSPCRERAGVACHRNGCLPWIGVARSAVQGWCTDRWFDSVDRVICNSHWVRRRLEDEGIAVSGVVWNGVPTTDARPPLQDPPTIGYAGRLFDKKGVDVLIRAIAQMTDPPAGLRVLIAGDGPQRAALESLSRELGVDDRIEFLGHLTREAMEDAIGRAWVQVAPSTWEEPFGLVGAEAQMRGTAAVVSDAGGLTEIIEDGVTGLTFPTGDAAGLAQALSSLMRDRDRAERMGEAGRVRALANFTEELVIDQFLAIYDDLLTATGASA